MQRTALRAAADAERYAAFLRRMSSPGELRDRVITTLDHVDQAFTRSLGSTGRNGALTFPDVHKISEGLLLSAWTSWETFGRDLLILDLSTDSSGVLGKEISKFRTKRASYRLAELILNHPDHPNRFVTWSEYSDIRSRANALLGMGHRYGNLARGEDLVLIKRIRNAIAHRSEKAWDSFRSLVITPPFSLAPRQRMGLTPGRLLSSHDWNNHKVMSEVIVVIKNCARALVP